MAWLDSRALVGQLHELSVENELCIAGLTQSPELAEEYLLLLVLIRYVLAVSQTIGIATSCHSLRLCQDIGKGDERSIEWVLELHGIAFVGIS